VKRVANQYEKIKEFLGPFSNKFSHKFPINPSEYTEKRLVFSPIEDELLCYGLKYFGKYDWNSIATAYVPTKTPRQLQIRFKNQVSKRGGDNPIKAISSFLPQSGVPGH